jgi:16S rRNA (cytidine1402-2'-O)-methyltransferase
MLYIVSTPIGNLSDISARAIETLKTVDLILAEDTRNTKKLLDRYKITTRIESLHEHSSDEKIAHYIEELKSDLKIAYVSDAGTPNISDPGGKLVARSLEGGVKVVPIPGPSSLTTLISVAPFSCSEFIFRGFFPKKKGRETMIKYIEGQKMPVFFFESPMRIKKTLLLLKQKLPTHSILIGRELTKIFEEILVIDLGSDEAEAKLGALTEKGELVFAVFKK